MPLGDNPPCYELFADRTRPPLEVVHDMKLLGLTIDSSLSFKAHIKSVCNKDNAKVSALRRVRKFIPSEVMVNIYKAFVLPHLEHCAPVLVGLSSGLSNKLELTNLGPLLFNLFINDLRSLVRYCFCHENIKFISSSQRVMFFLLYGD